MMPDPCSSLRAVVGVDSPGQKSAPGSEGGGVDCFELRGLVEEVHKNLHTRTKPFSRGIRKYLKVERGWEGDGEGQSKKGCDIFTGFNYTVMFCSYSGSMQCMGWARSRDCVTKQYPSFPGKTRKALLNKVRDCIRRKCTLKRVPSYSCISSRI